MRFVKVQETKRGLRAVVLGALLALFTVIGVAGVATPAHAAEEGTIHALANQTRAASGLGPLTLNGSLSAVAAGWAQQMAASGTLAHNPNYSGQIPPGWLRAGENVAQGYPSAAAVHQGWMASPGHAANILGDYTDIGIAHIAAGGTTWSVQVFAKYGATASAPAPVPAPVPAPAAPAPPAPEAAPQGQPIPQEAADVAAAEAAAADAAAKEKAAAQNAERRDRSDVSDAKDSDRADIASAPVARDGGAHPGALIAALAGGAALGAYLLRSRLARLGWARLAPANWGGLQK